MPRYISRAQSFKKSVVKARTQLVNTPQGPEMQEVTTPIIARFQLGGATQREVELALQRFQFKGLAEKENPARRISIYDTDEEARRQNWSPELKAQIEAVLDAGQSPDYFKVEKELLPKPWPSYDETDAGTILEVAQMVGVSLESVLAYERDNKNRKTVVKAIEDKLGDENEVVVSA